MGHMKRKRSRAQLASVALWRSFSERWRSDTSPNWALRPGVTAYPRFFVPTPGFHYTQYHLYYTSDTLHAPRWR